ncbi:MAG TPA: transposase [Usitatibacter sp.]|nr:transposase [Usitatibacter sp.]
MKVPNAGPRGSRHRRSLSEKIAIVRESMLPGMSAAHVAKRHHIALNVLYYWRKVYREVVDADLTAVPKAEDGEVADLKLQVRNLERLLGQRTLEVAILKDKLGIPGSGLEIGEDE